MTFIFLIGVACGSMSSAVCALVALHCVRHVSRPRQTLGVRPEIKGDKVNFKPYLEKTYVVREDLK
jgi:hypothetical protein